VEGNQATVSIFHVKFRLPGGYVHVVGLSSGGCVGGFLQPKFKTTTLSNAIRKKKRVIRRLRGCGEEIGLGVKRRTGLRLGLGLGLRI